MTDAQTVDLIVRHVERLDRAERIRFAELVAEANGAIILPPAAMAAVERLELAVRLGRTPDPRDFQAYRYALAAMDRDPAWIEKIMNLPGASLPLSSGKSGLGSRGQT